MEGWQPNGLNVTAHSPTAKVVVSTAGGASVVWTGFWADARVGKASANSKVKTKTQVLLEDFS
jgi:hypothetical protein